MTLHTFFLNRETYRDNLKRISQDLLNKIYKTNTAFSENLYSLDKETIHFVAEMLKTHDEDTRFLSKFLMSGIVQAESMAGGAAYTNFLFTLTLIKNFITYSNKNEQVGCISFFEEQIVPIIEESYLPPTKDEISKLISKICKDKLLSSAVETATEMAGLEGRVYVEDGKQPSYVLEHRPGFYFDLSPYSLFFGETKTWFGQQVKILLVDGFVEKVSEIDQILKGAFESRQPGIIIAKRFSEEVVATLKANFDKGILNIMPVRIPEDVKFVNALSDIASVCGADVVSTMKGDMLCFSSWNDLAVVQRIRCIPGQVVFEDNKNQAIISSQVQRLLNKRLECQSVDDLVDIIDFRIKSLTSNTLAFRLPEMNIVENQATRIKIDTSLRSVKSVLNNGLIDVESLKTKIETLSCEDNIGNRALKKSLIETLNEIAKTQKILPRLSVYLGLFLGLRQALMLCSGSGLVFTDQEPLP